MIRPTLAAREAAHPNPPSHHEDDACISTLTEASCAAQGSEQGRKGGLRQGAGTTSRHKPNCALPRTLLIHSLLRRSAQLPAIKLLEGLSPAKPRRCLRPPRRTRGASAPQRPARRARTAERKYQMLRHLRPDLQSDSPRQATRTTSSGASGTDVRGREPLRRLSSRKHALSSIGIALTLNHSPVAGRRFQAARGSIRNSFAVVAARTSASFCLCQRAFPTS